MGCGGSVPMSRLTGNRSDLQYFSNHPKLRDKRESLSIEEARKRRAECAKERSRRASVMGHLEAEKLSQRKRSNASMYNISASDVSEECRIPPFEPKQAMVLRSTPSSGTENNLEIDNPHKPVARLNSRNLGRKDVSPLEPNSARKTRIEITISPGSRPGSSRPDESEADLPGMVTSSRTNSRPHSKGDAEEEQRRREANAIVQQAISSALVKIRH